VIPTSDVKVFRANRAGFDLKPFMKADLAAAIARTEEPES
jgi:hypothetical protein